VGPPLADPVGGFLKGLADAGGAPLLAQGGGSKLPQGRGDVGRGRSGAVALVLGGDRAAWGSAGGASGIWSRSGGDRVEGRCGFALGRDRPGRDRPRVV